MAFDKNVFIEDLGKSPEIAKEVFELIKDNDIVKSHVKSISEQYFNENKGTAHGEAWTKVDEALKELGFEKPNGVKTTDFVAKLAKERKEFETEYNNLKGSKGDKAEIEAAWSKKLQDEQNLYKGKLTDLETQLNQERNQNKVNSRLLQLSEAISKVNFNPALPKAAVDEFKAIKLKYLAENAIEENGNLIWANDKKEPFKNANLLNANTDEVLKAVFKDFISEGTPGGSANPTAGTSKIEGKILLLSNNNFQTKMGFMEQFNKDLRAQGKTESDKEFSEIWQASISHYGYDKLPEQ